VFVFLLTGVFMKKLLLSLAAVSIAAFTFSASAASVSNPFNVKVILATACKMSTITDVDFLTYTSQQTGVQTATGGAFTVTCTNTLPYTLKFVSDTGAATDSGTFPTVNLAYTLGLSAPGASGTGVAQAYNVTGSMVAAQPGTCSTATCTETRTGAHTVFVVY
jgi:spore coat protein U-like protein